MTTQQIIVTIVTIIAVSILITGLGFWAWHLGEKTGYRGGYEVGAWHMLLYHNLTNEFPSYRWRHTHLHDNLQTIEDIQNTLKNPLETDNED